MALTRREVLDNLEQDWGGCVTAYAHMAPEAQAAWLAEQGYARFADVLAHVLAWWEEGCSAVAACAAGRPAASTLYDVDAFNAAAVARFAPSDEAAVIAVFEAQRRAWIELVEQLPEAAFTDGPISERLAMELTGHWQGHALPARDG